MLVAEILADAGDGLIALDIETAPIASEHARLARIRTNLAAARGRKRALKKLGDAEALRLAKSEVSALEKAEEHAERAGLDPHRADIRLVQIYAGGKRVAVIDMHKVDWAVLAPVWECPLVIHNALFDLAFLAKRGIEPVEVQGTLQAVRLLNGPDATSLETAVATYFGLVLHKDLQTSDWSAQKPFPRTDLVRGDGRGRDLAPRPEDPADTARADDGLRDPDRRDPGGRADAPTRPAPRHHGSG